MWRGDGRLPTRAALRGAAAVDLPGSVPLAGPRRGGRIGDRFHHGRALVRERSIRRTGTRQRGDRSPREPPGPGGGPRGVPHLPHRGPRAAPGRVRAHRVVLLLVSPLRRGVLAGAAPRSLERPRALPPPPDFFRRHDRELAPLP